MTQERSRLFGGVYDGRRVLLTGHTGFKGSWLALWLSELGAEVAGLGLAPSTYPSHWRLLGLDLAADDPVDLRDADAVRSAVERFAPEVVFHLAAQPLVRRSYRDPVETYLTNVLGVVNVLEACRDSRSVQAVVNATTDKVYRLDRGAHAYVESDPLGGHDPYSTSKAVSELVSASYRSSFDVPVATARAGNVIGGGDWSEDRLVPDIARAAVRGEAARIRNPNATRPWQHVLEPLSGYLRIGEMLLEHLVAPDAWNLGPHPDATLTVGDIVDRLRVAWTFDVVIDDGEHPFEAPELALDSTKADRELGWRPVWDAATTLDRTAEWYKALHASGEVKTRDDLAAYVSAARAAGLSWAS
jgi:CDP-glucose 4,6-dehydratase